MTSPDTVILSEMSLPWESVAAAPVSLYLVPALIVTWLSPLSVSEGAIPSLYSTVLVTVVLLPEESLTV